MQLARILGLYRWCRICEKHSKMLSPQDFIDVLFLGRKRSFKSAASALGINPSTMGRRLESIESRFGAALFVRTTGGLELTREGSIVSSAAEKMEAIRFDFERELLAREQQRPYSLTLTAAEWGVSLLTPILVDVAHAHPELKLHLRVDNSALDLTRREADLALRVGRPTERALMGKRVGTAVYGLFASPRYLAAHPAPRKLEGLTKHLFCALDETFAGAPHVAWQASLSRDAPIVLRTNSMLALIEAVEAGAGLSTLPCALAQGRPGLKRVMPDQASVERDLWIVFHRDLRKSRGLRLVVDALIGKLAPLFAAARP